MSLNLTLARPYAKAAFEYALAHNQVVAWENFCNLAGAIIQNPKIQKLLHDPNVTHEKVMQLFETLLKSSLNSEQHNFLKTLMYHNRLELLPEIANLFEQARTEHEKTLVVDVVSAFPMNDQQKSKLSQALKIRLQKEITLNVKEDPSLLGGVVITAEDFVIDGSVRSQLERMKTTIQA